MKTYLSSDGSWIAILPTLRLDKLTTSKQARQV